MLAESLVGAWHLRGKLMNVPPGAETANFHGRPYRRAERTLRDGTPVFEPNDKEHTQ